MNPYWGADFFDFLRIFLGRILQVGRVDLASDELQIGVLSLVGLSCALIGPFLVLKKMTMFANSLSHTILIGIVGASVLVHSLWGGEMFDLSTLLIGALIAALCTAIFSEGLLRFFKLSEDASTSLVFTSLFALGILFVTMYTRNLHLGLESIMGNVDALQKTDLHLAGFVFGVNALVITGFFHRLKMICFDPGFAHTLGVSTKAFHFLLLLLASISCVGAFRAVGVLVVLVFLVGPYLTARLFVFRLTTLLVLSSLIALMSVFLGVALSRHILSVWNLPVSTGGLVAVLIGVFFFISCGIKSYFLNRKVLCPKKSLS